METACLGCKFDAGTGRLAGSGPRLPGNETRITDIETRPTSRSSRTLLPAPNPPAVFYRTFRTGLPEGARRPAQIPAADFKPSGCPYSRPPVRTSRTISSRMMAPMVE
jgi:hypothetical protein